jgi:coproporphyrinogen III oxidase-like Fe-S oxidoreductase
VFAGSVSGVVERGMRRELPLSGPQRRLLMIYVHIPFCRHKCSFCDLVHEVPTGDLLLTAKDSPRQRYIEALCHEIRVRGQQLAGQDYQPIAVYWGGGTATILEEHELTAVAGALRDAFDLSQVDEFTIEGSPDTVSPEKFAVIRAAGFNRYSVGVQSFDEQRLRLMGRRHTAQQARDAVAMAYDAGLSEVNLDLMCGFPDEQRAEVTGNIAAALELPITQLTLYPFRPNQGTALRRRIDRAKVALHMRRQCAAFETARRMVLDAGYVEQASGYFGPISPFAGMFLQLRAEMIGLGSGAMSVLGGRSLTHAKGQLSHYLEDPLRYDADLPLTAEPVVCANLRGSLSMMEGVSRQAWEFATGTPLATSLDQPAVAALLDYFRGQGLVEDEAGLRLPPDRVGPALINLNAAAALMP